MAIKDSHRRKQRPTVSAANAKPAYRAFEISAKPQLYLEIRVRDPDPAECPSYAMLSLIRHERRNQQAITLEYGKSYQGMVMLVSIRGNNLTPVHEALKEHRAAWIAEFDADEYAAPADDNAPFIKTITIHTRRPEPPPPPDRRH